MKVGEDVRGREDSACQGSAEEEHRWFFFEVNKALEFDRAQTFGFRLDIPAGTAVRFEPGQSREVALVRFGGARKVGGLNSLTNGETTEDAKPAALEKARASGFKGA